MEFKNIVKNRRSYYSIEDKSPIEDSKIIELVEFAAKYTPSAYNKPGQMTALLLGDKHKQLWDLVTETLRDIVPADQLPGTENKINGFKAGYGTVLFFNDDSITRSLQENNPLYADRFPVWSEQTSGMIQFVIWNLLEEEGFGASLQHYNPLIDNKVQELLDLPKEWRLIAQMPFGTPSAQPGEREFADTAAHVKVFS